MYHHPRKIVNRWHRWSLWECHDIHQEMSWEWQATQDHSVWWSTARINDTEPNSTSSPTQHTHSEKVCRPNANQWITCLHLPLIDMALDSPPEANYPSTQKMTVFNLKGLSVPSWVCGQKERGEEEEEKGDLEWLKAMREIRLQSSVCTIINLNKQS